METIAKIRRLYHVNGKGFKTIAKELNLSKNTVKKIIKSDETILHYQRQESKFRVLEKYVDQVIEKLENDTKEPKRRRRTIKKIVEELQSAGYAGGYDAVHAFVLQWHRKQKHGIAKAFVPLEFEPGEAFQFDWSEEEVELASVLVRVKVAQVRLCHSRHFLLVAYPNEQLEMVLDAHNRAFLFFNGVCRKGIYDNMKTAVCAVLHGKERKWNPRFLQLCSHHLFEPVACTPASGWEKGQVENQVGTCRNNFFTPLIKVQTFEELNEHLENRCIAWAKNNEHPEWKQKTVFEVYQEERRCLIAYRGPFESYKVEQTVVSPYCFVNHATNSYSVECDYVGQPVDVRIYADRIVVVHRGRIIGQHPRSFLRNQRIYDPWHYMPLLERKPGALRNGAPFKRLQLPEALQKVREQLTHYSDGDKRFVRILLQVLPRGLDAVENACALALAQGGANDTVVLRYLEPALEKKQLQKMPLLLFPPEDTCCHYNVLLLIKNASSREVCCA